MNSDCTADEELNRRIATVTKVYTEALNRKIQEEVEQFCSGSQEGKQVNVWHVALGGLEYQKLGKRMKAINIFCLNGIL